MEDFGSYFYYDNVSLRMRTNVDGMEEYFYDQLEHMAGAVGENTVVLITVDTDFPYADSFASANREFGQYHPWIIGGIFLLAGSIISFIMTLVLITMGGRPCGWRGDKDPPVLDRPCKDRGYLCGAAPFCGFNYGGGDADRVRGMEDTGNAHYGGNHDLCV